MKRYIVTSLERLGHAVTQNLYVSLILVSLRKEYEGFVQNYNMHSMRKTVNKLHAILKLHEQTLPPKEVAPALHAIRAGRVQKNQKKKSHKAPHFAPNPKNPLTPKKDNPAKDAICHQCGEVATQGLRGSRKLKPGALSLYVGGGHRATIKAIGDFHLCLSVACLFCTIHCRLRHINKKRIEKLQHDVHLDSTDIKSIEKRVACMSGSWQKT
ncbi:hypothetical protein Tco_0150475 [Tanacetum coccineum]